MIGKCHTSYLQSVCSCFSFVKLSFPLQNKSYQERMNHCALCMRFVCKENCVDCAKKESCFRKCVIRQKSSPGRPQIYFLINFPQILFFLFQFLLLFLVFLLFFFVVVFVFILLLCLFFEIKNIYSDAHSAMRSGVIKKF